MKHIIIAAALIVIALPAHAQSFLTENLALPGAAGAIQEQLTGQLGGQGASAVNQYDKKHKGGEQPAASGGGTGSLISSDDYNLYFVRHPNDSDGIATLRIESPVAVQGCATVTFPPATLEKRGPGLFITVQDPQVSVDKSIRHPHYQCQTSGGSPTLDIELNRDNLRDDGIRHITMESSGGKQKFDLHINNNSISLTATAAGAFSLASKPGGGTHHFYDSRIIMLQAPAIGDDPALPAKINIIADKHNLSTPDHGQRQGNSFYFLDKTKSLSTRLTVESTIRLDTIEIDDIFMGADGPYTVKRKIDVFASRPGEFD